MRTILGFVRVLAILFLAFGLGGGFGFVAAAGEDIGDETDVEDQIGDAGPSEDEATDEGSTGEGEGGEDATGGESLGDEGATSGAPNTAAIESADVQPAAVIDLTAVKEFCVTGDPALLLQGVAIEIVLKTANGTQVAAQQYTCDSIATGSDQVTIDDLADGAGVNPVTGIAPFSISVSSPASVLVTEVDSGVSAQLDIPETVPDELNQEQTVAVTGATARVTNFIRATGSITITKTESVSGGPVEGVTFELVAWDGAACLLDVLGSATTDAYGVAVFSPVDAGEYCVDEVASGAYEDSDPIRVSVGPGEPVVLDTVTNVPVSATLVIEKREFDTDLLVPAACFQVTLSADPSMVIANGCDADDAGGEDGLTAVVVPSGFDLTITETVVPFGFAASSPVEALALAPGATSDPPVAVYSAPLPTGTLIVTNESCVGDGDGTVVTVLPPGTGQAADVPDCAPASGVVNVYGFATEPDDSPEAVLTIDETGSYVIDLPAGDHVVEDDASGAWESLTVVENGVTGANVTTYEASGAGTGAVVIAALTCDSAVEDDVEIRVSGPDSPVNAAAGDDGTGVASDTCEPINDLEFAIYPFGDLSAPPLTGTTGDDGDGDGRVLVSGVPVTDDRTGPHLFVSTRASVDVEAEFDVAPNPALTVITDLIFEAGATATATSAPAGTVTTLPSTGSGGPLSASGGIAWLLAGALSLIALGSAGYVARWRAA